MLFPKSTESSKQLMKLAVASAFDIKTRQDVRLVDVFVLQTQENGQHTLSPTASTGGAFMNVNRAEINVVNGRLSDILITLEARLKCPVVDETSLDGSYDFIVKFAEDASPEEFAKAFTDATGLTFSRAKREIEFTVVEPASTAQ